MEPTNLHRAVKSAIAEAEHACDPLQNTLMDRTDLQRIIGRLKRTLEQVERAYDAVQDQQAELSERLTRGHVQADWGHPAAPNQ